MLGMSSGRLDDLIHELHEEKMETINCLDCANCCKTISPAVTDRDLLRISKYLRIKPSCLVEQYLRIDEEEDYVFTKSPCPFLNDDNYCAIYPVRPKACREYPHTDRPRQRQILDLTMKNVSVCPVVYNIVEEVKRKSALIK